MPAPSPPLDSVFLVKTPENIAFQYGTAGPFLRLPAYFLDLLFRMVAVTVIFIAFLLIAAALEISFGGTSGAPVEAVLLIVLFLSEWFFAGFCEAYFNGQTPGKYILGLRVVTIDGKPINGLQAIMRNILRSVDIMPPIPIIGLAVMTCNKRYQRLGDLVCGTMVIVEEKPWLSGVAKLEDPRAIQLAAFIPGDFVVSKSLAKALSTYVERRRFFAAPRRKEMARHVAIPLLEKFGLPPDTSYDLLLCALYYRHFIADRRDDERHLAAAAQTALKTAAPQPAPIGPPNLPATIPPAPVGGGETFRVTVRDHRA